MKKLLCGLLVLIGLGLHPLFAQADTLQLTSKDSVVTTFWTVGMGINIVADTGDAFHDFTTIRNKWNMGPVPLRLNIGRYFQNGLGLEGIATYNRYKKGNIVDNNINPEDKVYYALDTRLSYDLNKLVGETGWFDPYVGAGIGYTHANDLGRATYNAVFGFRTWFSEHWGLDLNTSGKWSFGNEASNHVQHAAGVVYRFDIEKELSKKETEKLALINEQQRIEDSLASVRKAEEAAQAMAERLEREKEHARLAAEEQSKKVAELQRRQEIIDAVEALGPIHYDFNSSYLNGTSKAILDQLAGIIEQHPELRVRIEAHADARGTDAYNLWLSERRAKRASDYLQEKGIAAGRLEAKGMGETHILNECADGVVCSEAKHRENRRGVFIVLLF